MDRMPLSTEAILAYRALNRMVDHRWVDWALSMIAQGHCTDHLCILAADSPPFDQSESIELADKTFEELGLDWSNTERVVREYAVELLEDMLKGTRQSRNVLAELMGICVEMGYPKYLYGFYLLYFSEDDLQDSDFSGHLPEANRSNIQEMVADHALKWLAQFKETDLGYVGHSETLPTPS